MLQPAKYPVMFRSADLVLLSKSDLLDVIDDFDPAAAERHVRALANPAPMMFASARRPATLGPWVAWLQSQLVALRAKQMFRSTGFVAAPYALSQSRRSHAEGWDILSDRVEVET